ncbi:MAG TPA: tetratricopeptide repeat protein [Planctomycetes bacterium]|nr:tetratricopeptide repeat protein [Planctomycetota bacterium]
MDPAESTRREDWFEDDTTLLKELNECYRHAASTPVIPGYIHLLEIARGGQGVIYKAEQSSTRRDVAIKLLNETPGSSAAAFRRFQREVDLVASLRHPSIVTLHDGGTTPDGRPYLVMEYVRGVRLDQCPAFKRASLSPGEPAATRSVVALLLDVVRAVAYAHQRGVIHRDLKPANILVDVEGKPRVLDFGLASFTPDGEYADRTKSLGGFFVGTLPWASPEQARGEDVDVRTDVYALGVILYEALAGCRPYELPNDFSAALAIVCDPKPRRLAAALPGVDADLDAIAMRCLAPEPERRYQSALELQRDLERYLAGEPIEARRDSAWYLLSRRLKRSRRVIAGAAVVVLLLTGSLAFSLFALRSARAAHESERKKGVRLRDALHWVVDMIERVDPDKEGENARLVDLLVAQSPRIDEAFPDDPEDRILIRGAFAKTFEKLGRYDEAHGELQELQKDLVAREGENSRDVLIGRANLARVDFYRRRDASVIPSVEGLCDKLARALGENDAETIKARHMLAIMYRAAGRSDEATRIWEDLMKRVPEESDPSLRAGFEEALASTLSAEGELAKAIRMQRKVIDTYRSVHGANHTRTLSAEGDLAYYLVVNRQFDEAKKLYERIEPMAIERLGPTHPISIMILENHAKLIQDMGDLETAASLFERVLDARKKRFGPEHPRTLVTMSNLAMVKSRIGDIAASNEVFRQLLEIQRKIAPKDSFDLINALNSYGSGLCLLGRANEALPYHLEAVEKADRVLGRDNPSDAAFRMMLGNCLYKLGRLDEAETTTQGALDVMTKKLGPDHPNTKAARSLLERIAAQRAKLSSPSK